MKEVIIIGAGFSGIAAAKKLLEANKNILILEARDRIGGRSFSENSHKKGIRLDMGAAWIGPSQHLIWQWVKESNAETYETFNLGKNILVYQGRKSTYKGTIPKIDPISLAYLGWGISKINKLAKTISLEDPWSHPKAEEYDAETLQSWMNRNIRSKKARHLFSVGVQTVFAAEPSEISLLFALFYCASGESLDALLSIENGAQQTLLKKGTFGVIEKIAEPLYDKIQLNSPVKQIIQQENFVQIFTDTQIFEAKKCIITVPPALLGKIQFRPLLPQQKIQLYQRMPMGAAMKCFVIYPKPFWREKGLSGQIVSDEFPVKVTFDTGDANDDFGKLLVFVEGNDARKFIDYPLEERKKLIIEKLVKFLGLEAEEPLEYFDKCWTEEEWSGGCYTAIMGPNTLSHLGYNLRKTIGHIHFAGTETAKKWVGYLDGAIESGYRAANEIIETLNK